MSYQVMKQYAQFFHSPVMSIWNDDPTPIEACGDRAILILDGRTDINQYHYECKEWALKHGWIGYQLIKSDRFIDSNNEVYLL